MELPNPREQAKRRKTEPVPRPEIGCRQPSSFDQIPVYWHGPLDLDRGPEGILRFPLPEYAEEFHAACHGQDYRSIINELIENLRALLKHSAWPFGDTRGEKKAQDRTADELAEAIRDWLYREAGERGALLE